MRVIQGRREGKRRQWEAGVQTAMGTIHNHQKVQTACVPQVRDRQMECSLSLQWNSTQP